MLFSGMKRGLLLIPILFVALVLLTGGCAITGGGGRPWGKGVTPFVGKERLKGAFLKNVKDPWVWVPLAGAVVAGSTAIDENLLNWASRHTPLYGSSGGAEDASGYTMDIAAYINYATILITPGADMPARWAEWKARGFLAELAAWELTSRTTAWLKDTTARTRPNGADRRSFPSLNAAKVAVHTTLAIRNLSYLELSPRNRRLTELSLRGLAIAGMWARLEADAHYPSDVLFGMALGNFIGGFIADGFIDSPSTTLSLVPISRGGIFALSFRF